MDRQRIDKWLWHARVVRTRSAASMLVTGGLVRLNRTRVTAPSQLVRANDVITVALDRTVRILKVTGFAERRGDAAVAQTLWEDLTPPPPHESLKAAFREPGSGRPTKRDRRAIDRLIGDDD